MGACIAFFRLVSQVIQPFNGLNTGTQAQYIVPALRGLIGGFNPHRDPHRIRPRATGDRFVAKKNGNGEGSRPRKRPDGRWEARYWKDGRRKSIYAATRKEVAEKLRYAMSTKDDVCAIEATNITFAEFLMQYEDVARETMKRRSYETYRDISRKHLLPAFGRPLASF